MVRLSSRQSMTPSNSNGGVEPGGASMTYNENVVTGPMGKVLEGSGNAPERFDGPPVAKVACAGSAIASGVSVGDGDADGDGDGDAAAGVGVEDGDGEVDGNMAGLGDADGTT